jgi:hypothetical protein
LILATTGVTGFLIVLAWLIVAALYRPVLRTNLIEIALGHAEGVRRVSNPATSTEIENRLNNLTSGMGDAPIVVILHAAVGASRTAGLGDPKAYFVVPAKSVDDPPTTLPLEDVLKPFATRGERASTLLILDYEVNSGESSSAIDRSDFVAVLKNALRDLAARSPKLAVLAACDERQFNWSMEGEGRSIFDVAVRTYLDGSVGPQGQFTVAQLGDNVRRRVSHWVKTNRSEAIQTPLVLAGPELAFRWIPTAELRESLKSPAKEVPEGETPKSDIATKMFDEWKNWHELNKSSPPPYRHAAVAWRLYTSSLLRAERLARLGDDDSAREILKTLNGYRETAKSALEQAELGPAWSLAQLKRKVGRGYEGRRAEAARYEKAIDKLLESDLSPGGVLANAGRPARLNAEAKADPGKPAPDAAAPRPPAQPTGESIRELLTALTVDGDTRPRYVEGQMPVWYLEFVKIGGEKPELRSQRVSLIKRAVKIRELAESAVARETVTIPWIRALVDAADKERRLAQDGLFGRDDEALATSGIKLNGAGAKYEKAQKAADQIAEAFELLWEVQDGYPYLAAWGARSEHANAVEAAIDQSIKLAALIYRRGLPNPADEVEPKALFDRCSSLKKAFQDLRRSAEVPDREDWLQIDALLQTPWIELSSRRKLLSLARELTPKVALVESAWSADSSIVGPSPDPVFTRTVDGLAKWEITQLRLAGYDVKETGESPVRARDEARSKLAVIAKDDKTALEVDRLARNLAAADLAYVARKAGGELALNRELADQESRAFRLWNAHRLLDDFDVRAADRLLASLNGELPEESREVEDLADRMRKSELALTAQPSKNGSTVTLRAQGKFPPGSQAVIFFNHDPLVEVSPFYQMVSAEQPNARDFQFDNRGESELKLAPVAFFRGNSSHAERLALPVTESVSVEIHQILSKEEAGGKTVRIRDQFLGHPTVGYFHLNRTLNYFLEIKNKSDREIKAYIERELSDLKSADSRVLKAGELIKVGGKVDGTRGFEDMKPKILKVTVKENNKEGRRLCSPLEVQMVPVDPMKYVHVIPNFRGTSYCFTVVHSSEDDAPTPVDIVVGMEPHQPFELQENYQFPIRLPRGGRIRLTYEMTDQIDNFSWGYRVNDGKAVVYSSRANEKKTEPDPAKPEADKKAAAPANGGGP